MKEEIKNMIIQSYEEDKFSSINKRGLNLSGDLYQDVDLYYDQYIELMTFKEDSKKNLLQLISIDEADFDNLAILMSQWGMLNDILTHKYNMDISQVYPKLKIELIIIGQTVDIGLAHLSAIISRNNRMKIIPYKINLNYWKGIYFAEEIAWGFDASVNENLYKDIKLPFL